MFHIAADAGFLFTGTAQVAEWLRRPLLVREVVGSNPGRVKPKTWIFSINPYNPSVPFLGRYKFHPFVSKPENYRYHGMLQEKEGWFYFPSNMK